MKKFVVQQRISGPITSSIASRIFGWCTSSSAQVKSRCVLWRQLDRKSTRLNSSHTVIYTLSLHDALPISEDIWPDHVLDCIQDLRVVHEFVGPGEEQVRLVAPVRSEEHTSELQSHSDLHSFPTRRSSDLRGYLARSRPRLHPGSSGGARVRRPR